MRSPTEKIIAWDEVALVSKRLHDQGRRVVSTNGCFDLLHLGHLNYLQQARALGDCLWVGVNADDSVRRLKGPKRPLQDQQTRVLQLAALECVDYVTVFTEDTPVQWLERVRPFVHVKGGDYSTAQLPEKNVVEKSGGQVRCLSLTEGYSTTALIEKIQRL